MQQPREYVLYLPFNDVEIYVFALAVPLENAIYWVHADISPDISINVESVRQNWYGLERKHLLLFI